MLIEQTGLLEQLMQLPLIVYFTDASTGELKNIKIDTLKSQTLLDVTHQLMQHEEVTQCVSFNNYTHNVRYRIYDDKKKIKLSVFSLSNDNSSKTLQ